MRFSQSGGSGPGACRSEALLGASCKQRHSVASAHFPSDGTRSPLGPADGPLQPALPATPFLTLTVDLWPMDQDGLTLLTLSRGA